MAYIFGLIITVLAFIVIYYFTTIDKNQKIIIAISIFVFVSLAFAYNEYQNIKEKKMLDAVLKFRQSKTIICGNIKVNSTNFTLSVGTYTFIGKKNTPYYAQMISASTCE